MQTITMYSTQWCPFCQRAEQYLKRKGVVSLNKIAVDRDPAQRDIMVARSGWRSVPQIFIGEQHIGGFDDLLELDRAGALDPLLSV